MRSINKFNNTGGEFSRTRCTSSRARRGGRSEQEISKAMRQTGRSAQRRAVADTRAQRSTRRCSGL